MKRFNNIYHKIYDINNLKLADKRARKGKLKKKDVQSHILNENDNLIDLHYLLLNKEYTTSKYKVYTIFDGKEREIYKLPYYPDRICHHAIMNILEPILVSLFTKDTYSSIKGRGIHKTLKNIKNSLKDKENTQYCLKIDIRKFYPNINHDILKNILRKKFKDKDLLWLLDNIIDSTSGVPIGNYLSQYFANIYLTYFDHWIKENKRIKYYFRYCDDIVIFSKDKESLHILLRDIIEYLKHNLKLELKQNYQIFPINKRGLDFIGYKFYHTHILLRKSIKLRFINMIKYNNNIKSRASYNGWLSWCNSINLQRKYIKNEK